MTYQSIALWIGAVLLVLLLASCGRSAPQRSSTPSAPEQGEVLVSLWYPLSGEEKLRFDSVVSGYADRAKGRRVRISMRPMRLERLETYLQESDLGRRAPTMLLAPQELLAGLVREGLAAPLEGLVPAVLRDRFPPSLWEKASAQDKTYAVPGDKEGRHFFVLSASASPSAQREAMALILELSTRLD